MAAWRGAMRPRCQRSTVSGRSRSRMWCSTPRGSRWSRTARNTPVCGSAPDPRAVQLPFDDHDLVPQRQGLRLVGAVTHWQEPVHRERVGDAEVRQSQQHGQHHHLAIAGDPTDAGTSATTRSRSDPRHRRDQCGRTFRHPQRGRLQQHHAGCDLTIAQVTGQPGQRRMCSIDQELALPDVGGSGSASHSG
jgi:hypothetical protein